MKKDRMNDRGRTFPVDPNLPRWVCQDCHNPLCIIGVESYADKFLNDSSRSGVQTSSIHGATANGVLASTRMDNSFVVLPKQRPPAQGHSSCPHGGAAPHRTDQQSGKTMEESFVVVYKSESVCDGGGTQLSLPQGGHSSHMQPNNTGFHSTMTVLKRAFEIATTQTQVEQPLCLKCMRVLSDKLEKEVEDLNRDNEAYEACLQLLELEARDALSDADFLKAKLKTEEDERKLEVEIQEILKQKAEVDAESKELELKASRFKELEERYWQEFNNFQFQLISHQEERDAISAKIEVSQAHFSVLKRTSVLNDAFPIYHDGEFGTINNFRLSHLPKVPVEWDEINAAWGQACLLLHTMCQYLRPKFQYRIKILPMGSYPRIMDTNNNTYELFGPVNLFWSTRYDKAMSLFLTCLKDFAEFAYSKDHENNIPPDKCFRLPYKIENDRVVCSRSESDKLESHSITQSFNKQENWTRALKHTLCNLKWALYWFIGNRNFQPLSALVSSHAEVAAVGSLSTKRGADSKSVVRCT
ncbi:beclin-1-like protein isoform X2 [Tripterygium wilfordii]|uniref:beclin-1-like protein isoform X2 n=1 Tax=Tripterygium wilfordii TaxID=458696 RepID=UPI0018F80936|nr:beclin-1-like protein isoform X2 [Tripterygium wilfordii]